MGYWGDVGRVAGFFARGWDRTGGILRDRFGLIGLDRPNSFYSVQERGIGLRMIADILIAAPEQFWVMKREADERARYAANRS